ncbi:hypothetical protein [Photobacterium lutimaris]|uniref:WalW protein n=1 Tax=Photobacterium lutimaris TaxID=388278 RepID=A0A2T3J2R2_9GAMM|nr:hypothetical protein [Photobacterium lutimaris]PSU35570.1 hypothetical protein C9I99_00680 [Photobacterium lutimaris]TDR78621.1 hypothetical protein DFP78_101133 [Photobacterium lutimaris]
MGAKLAVVIHAEEEFDWHGGFYRSNTAVSHHVELIKLIQAMLDLGAHVTLAMDYPFVTSKGGEEVIHFCKGCSNGTIEFATHLHPWVNPPFEEPLDGNQVSNRHSYPGNLSPDLEYQKLKVLTDKIEEVTGSRPVTYLAGRYGIGRNSQEILRSLGYEVDLSISAFSDFSHQQGPDFSQYNNALFSKGGITYLPHTCCRISRFKWLSSWLQKNPSYLNGRDIVSRVVRKVFGIVTYRLSPEGVDLNNLICAANHQIEMGHEYLILSFHSPSAKLGQTPYVQTHEDKLRFDAVTLDFIEWFMHQPDVEVFTPQRLASLKSIV